MSCSKSMNKEWIVSIYSDGALVEKVARGLTKQGVLKEDAI